MLQSDHILLACRCHKVEKVKNKSKTLLHQVVLKAKISTAQVYKRMGQWIKFIVKSKNKTRQGFQQLHSPRLQDVLSCFSLLLTSLLVHLPCT